MLTKVALGGLAQEEMVLQEWALRVGRLPGNELKELEEDTVVFHVPPWMVLEMLKTGRGLREPGPPAASLDCPG